MTTVINEVTLLQVEFLISKIPCLSQMEGYICSFVICNYQWALIYCSMSSVTIIRLSFFFYSDLFYATTFSVKTQGITVSESENQIRLLYSERAWISENKVCGNIMVNSKYFIMSMQQLSENADASWACNCTQKIQCPE